MNKIIKRKIDDANRSQCRKLEQATLQINSHQPISKLQKTLQSQEIQLYNSVNLQHINNNADHVWNHIEHLNNKQLEFQYIPQQLRNEQWMYENIKQKINQDKIKENQNLLNRDAKRILLKSAFESKRDKNLKIYSKLNLPISKSPKPLTFPDDIALFQRLSEPKQQFIPEATYDMPDYKGFPLRNLNHIDRHKNTILIQHYSNTNLIPKRVFKKCMSQPFVSQKQIKEDQMNTIQMDEKNIDDQFKEDAMDELDEFERNLKKHTPSMYSQVKHQEIRLLRSMEGFKSVQKIRSLPNYQQILGAQIRQEFFNKQ